MTTFFERRLALLIPVSRQPPKITRDWAQALNWRSRGRRSEAASAMTPDQGRAGSGARSCAQSSLPGNCGGVQTLRRLMPFRILFTYAAIITGLFVGSQINDRREIAGLKHEVDVWSQGNFVVVGMTNWLAPHGAEWSRRRVGQ